MATVPEVKHRKILVAVSYDSEATAYAISWCLTNVVSSNFKDTLILLFVKKRPALYVARDGTGDSMSSDDIAALERSSNEKANSLLEKAKRVCTQYDHQDIRLETRIESGDVIDVICRMVEMLHVDMLVLGNHITASITSVSNQCAYNVKCPVVMVKRPTTTAGSK